MTVQDREAITPRGGTILQHGVQIPGHGFGGRTGFRIRMRRFRIVVPRDLTLVGQIIQSPDACTCGNLRRDPVEGLLKDGEGLRTIDRNGPIVTVCLSLG
ncbi:hypothetical protein [Paracoccus sp. MKU1]|uniref:hypothetical protein n=1 Tax=Paracoccus sp. MKU1 TaxID=1745182 RepID=UPI000719180A|nr:hypothetical protein [Paracoccus sp. MKU1]KRW97782.1 hypothetical protein AQY21_01675 [Paracoccus sp. MKU1]